MTFNIKMSILLVYNKQDNIDLNEFDGNIYIDKETNITRVFNINRNIDITIDLIEDKNVNDSLRGNRYAYVYLIENAKVNKNWINSVLINTLENPSINPNINFININK